MARTKTTETNVEQSEIKATEAQTETPSGESLIPPNFKPITNRQKAEDMAESLKLPAAPGRKVNFDQMIDWLGLLTEDQWRLVVVYVYRVWPVIVRGQDPANIDQDKGDAISYIDKFGEPFGRSDILERHGAGHYDFYVNDIGSTKGSKGNLFKAQLNVPLSEAEPIINLTELDWENKNNVAYINLLRAKGVVEGNQPKQQNSSSTTDSMMIRELLGWVRSLTEADRNKIKTENPDNVLIQHILSNATMGAEKSLDFMTKQLEKDKGEGPAALMTAMSSMIQAILAGQSKDKGDSTLLVAMMNNQMELTKLMMQNNSSSNNKEEGDEFSKLKTLLEIAKDLKGGRASEGGWIDKAIEHGAPVLSKVFDTINNVLILRARGIPARMPTGQQQQQQPNPQQPVNRGAIPDGWAQRAADRQASPGPQPVEQTMQPEVMQQQQLTQEQEFVLQYGGLILQNMASGPGDDFAAWVSEGLGPAAFLNIKRMGKDNILAALKSVPDFWEPAMQNFEEAHVTRFVEEFFSFDPYKQDDEGGE